MKSYLIGAGLIGGGVLVAFLLGVFAPTPPKEEPPPQSPIVSTAPVEIRAGSLTVRGTGTVRPTDEVTLTAEVSGRLVSTSEALVSGGRFGAGETLARVDPSDYRNAVRQAEAQVTRAQFAVLQAREEVAVAREEYERIQRRTGAAPEPDSTELGRLVFREPQLRQAEANLASARATLDNAETRLSRTAVRAPFNGVVRTRQATLGDYVAPGTPIATIFATDAVEVVVSLPSRQAALIDNLWTSVRRSSDALPARVHARYGGDRFTWSGYVDRVEGAIDTQTRTVDVVVRVPDPYDGGGPRVSPQRAEQPFRSSRPPLTVGQFVDVDIEGRRNAEYAVIPRRALRTRDADQPPMVWTVVGDTMLVEQAVRPIQTVENRTYLAPTAALTPGTRVITTDLRIYSDSMRVRLNE